MNGRLLATGTAVAIALTLTACGGGHPLASLTAGGAQQTQQTEPSAPVAASSSLGDSGAFAALSSRDADVEACRNLQQAVAAFLADKNQDTMDSVAAALADRPGAAMSPSLDSAFSALSDDVQNAMLGDTAAATAQSDEAAVANGCASAGVRLPAGFTD